MTELTVEIKSVYGNELIYPACDTSRVLCRLMGKKTLSDNDVKQLKSIGYTFKVKGKEL